MVDVLLASANYMALDSKQSRKRRPYPPLATLYAASELRAAGWNVELFDATLASGEQEFEATLGRMRPRIVALYEDSFNFLSKMCLTRMREAAQCMARAAQAHGATVIAAGPDVSDRPELYLQHGVGFAIAGEADHVLTELVAAIVRGGDGAAIPGVVIDDPSSPSGVRRAPARVPERHPDRFPLPAWDLVDVDRYRQVWTEAHGYFSLNLVTTRGCPFHCDWCAKPVWGQRYAMHSPARVADELAFIKRSVRPDHVWFADDIFGLRPQWVADFAREVGTRDARIPFTIQSRADLMTDDAVAGLQRAGCVEVWLGAESGSQTVLDAMNKGIRVAEIVAARARLKRAGIRACFFIQFGYPGETLADIRLTVRLVREQLPDDIGISISYPLPGTRFYDRVGEQLGEKTNWVDSDDLAMMFQGTYDSRFYRRLHALLHEDLELRHRVACGGAQAAAAGRRLDHLAELWRDLELTEAHHRMPNPTSLAAVPVLAAPDLSRHAN